MRKWDGPYCSFGYLSLFSDPLDWQNEAKEKYCNFATFNRIVDTKTSIIQTEPKYNSWLENESRPIMNF